MIWLTGSTTWKVNFKADSEEMLSITFGTISFVNFAYILCKGTLHIYGLLANIESLIQASNKKWNHRPFVESFALILSKSFFLCKKNAEILLVSGSKTSKVKVEANNDEMLTKKVMIMFNSIPSFLVFWRRDMSNRWGL